MAFEGVPRGSVIKGPADGEEPIGEVWEPPEPNDSPEEIIPKAAETSYDMVGYVADLPPPSGELGRIIPSKPAMLQQPIPRPPRPQSK